MKKYLILGVCLIILTNLFVLGGVFYNRSGTPVGLLTLSEREVSLPYLSGFEKENSGVALTLEWRALDNRDDEYIYYNNRTIAMTQSELVALGFSADLDKTNRWEQSRTLYFALEFNGDLYQQSLANRQKYYQKALARFELDPEDEKLKQEKESALDSFTREKEHNSRLFFIDVARDYETLAAKYGSHENTIIVKGRAQPYYAPQKHQYMLRLEHLHVQQINVPAQFVSEFTKLKTAQTPRRNSAPYTVTIHWGQRLEPWITDVSVNATF